MAQTANLGLPLIDANMTADVPRDMNALANAVDTAVTEAVEGVTVPDATTTQKGVVQLNDTTTSTNKTQAGTADAVRRAYERGASAESSAKDYVDTKPWQKIKLTTDDGSAQYIANTDLNTLYTKSGLYLVDSPTNGPAIVPGGVNLFYLEVIVSSNADYVLQKAYNYFVGSFQMRIRKGAVWQPWSTDLFTSVANGKQAIATAISDKGVPASGSDEFSVLASKISQISTGKKFADISVGTLSANTPRNVDIGFSPRVVIIHETTASTSTDYREYSAGKTPTGLDWKNGQFSSVYVSSTISSVITINTPSTVYNVRVWAWD